MTTLKACVALLSARSNKPRRNRDRYRRRAATKRWISTLASRSTNTPNVGAEILALDRVTLPLGDENVFARTSWTWQRGEQWAIIGANGSGKSLLIEALLGRIPPRRGEMRVPFPDTIAVVSPAEQGE